MFHSLTTQVIPIVFLCGLILPSTSPSSELRQIRTSLVGLTTAQIILLEITHNTTSGALADTNALRKVFSKRMSELGYTVSTDPTKKFDVVVQLHCEEDEDIKTHTIPIDDPEFKPTSSRIQGPPCTFSYQFGGRTISWKRIDRIVFAEGLKVINAIKLTQKISHASSWTTHYLELYDFPLLFSAEWGHIDRLLKILHAPGTSHHRQRFILSLFGEIRAAKAFPSLVDALKKEYLTVAATRALGHFGEEARPHLLNLLQTSPKPEIQAAAAYGLGNVGALTGDTRSTPFLLEVLSIPGVDMRVQTEIVWALGKAPDFASFPILSDLEERIWQSSSKDPALAKLRQAVDWSIREVRQGGHTDDY